MKHKNGFLVLAPVVRVDLYASEACESVRVEACFGILRERSIFSPSINRYSDSGHNRALKEESPTICGQEIGSFLGTVPRARRRRLRAPEKSGQRRQESIGISTGTGG